jgi:predicted RNase H-like HicB family nuclease
MRHDYHVVYTTIEDGWIMATVPELPGAVTQGRDLDEARANIKEAVELLLQSYRENAARARRATPCGKRSRWKCPPNESRSESDILASLDLDATDCLCGGRVDRGPLRSPSKWRIAVFWDGIRRRAHAARGLPLADPVPRGSRD